MAGKYPKVPFDEIPQVRDYISLTSRQQHVYFGRDHPKYNLELFTWLLAMLKDDVFLHIPLRDVENLKVEIINTLSRNLAYYQIYPQRFGYKPRNLVASTLMYLQYRLLRVRSGHKLPPLSLRPLSKHKFGELVTKVTDNNQLWLYSDYFVKRFKWREKHGRVIRSEL